MITVGMRLRELRKKRRISLLELSRVTGMGYSFLSGLENDKHSITIANLQKLAEFFGVNLIYFLQEETEENVKITRAEDGKKFELEGGMVFQVQTPSNAKNVQVSRVYLPTYTPRNPTTHNHGEGEEVLMVLNGILYVTIGSKEYELFQGDSICFDSSYEHAIFTRKSTADLILITSPPVEITEHSV